MRTERAEVVDPEFSLLSDSKCLYDALNNELPQDDKKAAVELPIIEQILKRMNGLGAGGYPITLILPMRSPS
jgi:hypothetical protein